MNLLEHVISKGGTGTIECAVIAAVASKAGCSHRTLYMIGRGHKKASALLARDIEQATDGAVTRHDLRPDVFGPAPEPPARHEAA
jgi:DNA-binding transcriptional regulator YdaS (Cro superfamily)